MLFPVKRQHQLCECWLGSVATRGFQPELPPRRLVQSETLEQRRGHAMMDDDLSRFRNYAAECARLAQRAAEKDRAVLMEIAAAWLACAEQAERKPPSASGQDRISESWQLDGRRSTVARDH